MTFDSSVTINCYKDYQKELIWTDKDWSLSKHCYKLVTSERFAPNQDLEEETTRNCEHIKKSGIHIVCYNNQIDTFE